MTSSFPFASARPYLIAAGTRDPNRIGGWLLFFCLNLTVVSPLLILVSAVRADFFIEVLVWLHAAYGMVMGAALWSRTRHVIGMLQIYFFTGFFVKVVGLIVLLLDATVGRPEDGAAVAAELAGCLVSLTVLLVWVRYFQTSRRVQKTYGSNLFT